MALDWNFTCSLTGCDLGGILHQPMCITFLPIGFFSFIFFIMNSLPTDFNAVNSKTWWHYPNSFAVTSWSVLATSVEKICHFIFLITNNMCSEIKEEWWVDEQERHEEQRATDKILMQNIPKEFRLSCSQWAEKPPLSALSLFFHICSSLPHLIWERRYWILELSQLRLIPSGLCVYLCWSTKDERIVCVFVFERKGPSERKEKVAHRARKILYSFKTLSRLMGKNERKQPTYSSSWLVCLNLLNYALSLIVHPPRSEGIKTALKFFFATRHCWGISFSSQHHFHFRLTKLSVSSSQTLKRPQLLRDR